MNSIKKPTTPVAVAVVSFIALFVLGVTGHPYSSLAAVFWICAVIASAVALSQMKNSSS